ncbi:MAG: hypothetical protein J7L55_00920 [Desulfurococcales archaeon]|nr:hypothetical protein [Desulfurococcales archaeon]
MFVPSAALALFTLAVAVGVGNNMGVISGPSVGSRLIREESLLILSVSGLLAGYVLEGWKLHSAVHLSEEESVVTMLLAVGVLTALTLGGFITSITQIFVGIYVGMLACGGSSYGLSEVLRIGGYWLLTFALSVATSYAFMKIMGGRKSNTLINNLLTLKLTSVVLVFFTAYTLGANTVGFIASFAPSTLPGELVSAATVVGIVAGALIVRGGKGAMKLGSGFYGLRYTSTVVPYISALILTEIGTQLSIPLPLSIALFSGVLGAAVGLKFRLLRGRDVVIYALISWVIPLIISVAISYLIFTSLSLCTH